MPEIRGVPPLDPAWLPAFQQWKQEHTSWIPDFGFWNYLNLRADADLAAAFTKLFWPDFVEVDGCVLLARSYDPENFAHWMQHLQGNRRDVESQLNHTHIGDLFLNHRPGDGFSSELWDYLGKMLCIMWKHAVQEAYPDKQFAFFMTEPGAPDGEISFCQAA